VESSWIVKYSGNADSLSGKLRKCLDTNDHILVIKVVNDKQGWVPKSDWNIINGFFDWHSHYLELQINSKKYFIKNIYRINKHVF